ncbi:TetR/AcrR family transcriptional regulator [Gulosibacter sp. 10]|uniref:TetR/AcrR family transcriptional regulator n=1 Tax=Gulosibacter sp. 10 TaxID=1255570 RepID=UPI00097F379B|nr:TetR/AcrR family transcriptional regulator [Gulosibacter sp. 10]SJM60961.1 Transcriptional regulator, TetR family [Gulosibacter sp. 10]
MPPQTPLTRDGVVTAALEFTREEGLRALTMRALGKRLGVTPMALYRHIDGREELARLVVDRVGSLVQPTPPAGAGWEAKTRAWALAQREVLRRHPGVAAWLIDNGPAGDEAYRLLDLLASALTDAGLKDAAVARGSVLVMSWTFSRVAVEDQADARERSGRSSRARSFITGLRQSDPEKYADAARIGPEVFGLSMEEIFETGLDWIIAGIRERRASDG